MPLTEHQGDLFTSQAQSLAHGVNCKGQMGAGIAKSFKERYPDMYDAYRTHCQQGLLAPGEIFSYYIADQDLWIYNIASQDFPGPHATLPHLIKGTINAVLHARSGAVSGASPGSTCTKPSASLRARPKSRSSCGRCENS